MPIPHPRWVPFQCRSPTVCVYTFIASLFVALASASSAADKLDRTVLPIAEPNYPHSTVLDVREAKAPPRFQVKAPAGAPNVLIVLIDDMGFGMPSAFGGPDPHADGGPPGQDRDCATTSSTPRRSVRRRARLCSPAAITT